MARILFILLAATAWGQHHNLRHYGPERGLRGSRVIAIDQDSAGYLWVETDEDLFRHDGYRFKPQPAGRPPHRESKPPGAAASLGEPLFVDREGSLWAGLQDGLARYLGFGEWVSWDRREGLGSGPVTALARDGAGALWATVAGADYRLGAGEAFVRGELPPLAKEADWEASGEEIRVLTGGAWRRIATSNAKRIAAAPEGAVWVSDDGTVTRALGESGGGWRIASERPEPVRELGAIAFIGVDAYGRIWIGGRRGVAVKQGERWITLGAKDGLAADSATAFLAEPAGAVWIGTAGGLSRFAGRELREYPVLPVISPLSPLAPQDSFAASIGILSFRNEDEPRLSYSLASIQSERWIETRPGLIVFSSLQSGRHTLKVRAAGDPETAEAQVTFTVNRPWYLAWWAALLWIALAAIGLRALVVWRTSILERENRWLEQIVEERSAAIGEARDRAQQANKMKSELLAVVSHEIRNPLNGVLGVTQLQREMNLDSWQRRLVDIAHESAVSAVRLLDDLLDLSRIETGQLGFADRPFELRACVEGVVRATDLAARRAGLQLRLEFDTALPEWVRGDGLRLRQVLLNLATNAVKFTPQGSVALTARLRSLEQGRAEVEFAVSDTGIGIPGHSRDIIFEPFRQLDQSRWRKGAGLGLTISKNLVEGFGGCLDFVSEPGAGTRFWFTIRLPVAAPEPPAPPPKEAEPGVRILLVDDDPVNQELTALLLNHLGHEVEIASDGAEAVERVAVKEFGVVLMDRHMQNMDGLAAASEIRKREQGAGRHVPIIAMTAATLPEDRQQCLDAGMDGYVAKPVSLDALREAIRVARRGGG